MKITQGSWITCILLILVYSCSSRKLQTSVPNCNESISVQGKAFATLFQQSAAEYKALCFQAFNIARLRVDQDTIQNSLPRAIITDLDETILDNSPYAVHLWGIHQVFDSASWKSWTDQAAAKAVPGAVEFLQYASSKGIRIFYISNRTSVEKAATLENLKRLSLPDANPEYLLFRTDRSGKETRRQQVLGKYRVVLLLGDNLSDFTDAFDKKPFPARDAAVIKWQEEFGRRFIVLPNSVYGDWEGALFGFKNMSPSQRDSVYKASLKGY